MVVGVHWGKNWIGEAQDSETLLYDTVMVGTGLHAFVKNHRTVQHEEWSLMHEKFLQVI